MSFAFWWLTTIHIPFRSVFAAWVSRTMARVLKRMDSRLLCHWAHPCRLIHPVFFRVGTSGEKEGSHERSCNSQIESRIESHHSSPEWRFERFCRPVQGTQTTHAGGLPADDEQYC